MIYLGPTLQRRVMAVFHYALRPNGYLVLGSSETIGNYGDLFALQDRKHKIYLRKGVAQRPVLEFTAATPPVRAPREYERPDEEAATAANVFREADRVLLTRYSPAGVLINSDMDI